MIDFQPQRARGQGPTLVEQLVAAVLRAIEQQVLRPGMSLPSVRELARQYEISTFTVASAYSRLVSLGWLAARPERATGWPRRTRPRAGARRRRGSRRA